MKTYRLIFLSILILYTYTPAQTVLFRDGIFLHHSTGLCIWGPNGSSTSVPQEITAYNNAHGYTGAMAVDLGEVGWPIGMGNDWYIWHDIFENQIPSANINPYLQSQPIIVIKSCYPSSAITGIGQPSDTLSPTIKSIYNYKWHWRHIVTVMKAHPENFFVIWTNAPLVQASTNPQSAHWSHKFCTWAKDTLAEGMDPGFGAFPPNVYVFDFFHKLADPNGYLSPSYAQGSTNSHPNSAATELVAPQFVQEVFDNSIIYELIYSGQDTIPPGKPTGLLINGGNDSLNISWDRNPENDMAFYVLFRAVSQDTNLLISDYNPIDTIPQTLPGVMTVHTTDYDTSAIKSGNYISYRVCAVDSANLMSEFSDAAGAGLPQISWTLASINSGTTTSLPLSSFLYDPDNTFPELVINISNLNNLLVSAIGDSLQISPDPLSYSGPGGFDLQVTDPDGFWDSDSIRLDVLAQDTTAPGKPTGVAIIASNDSIQISWDRNPENDVVYYITYRAVSADTNLTISDYDSINTISQPSPGVTVVHFSDYDTSAIKAGNYLSYKICAVDTGRLKSELSEAAGAGLPKISWTLASINNGTTTSLPLSSFLYDPDNEISELQIDISNIHNLQTSIINDSLTITPDPLTYSGPAGFDLQVSDPDDCWDQDSIFLDVIPAVDLKPGEPPWSDHFQLYQNHPNPFNPSTAIDFNIPQLQGKMAHVTINIYDVTGRLVKTLLNKNLPPGAYSVVWDGSNQNGTTVAGGFYICRMLTEKHNFSRKIVFLK